MGLTAAMQPPQLIFVLNLNKLVFAIILSFEYAKLTLNVHRIVTLFVVLVVRFILHPMAFDC